MKINNKIILEKEKKGRGKTRGEGNKEPESSTGKQHATASATTANRVHNLRKKKEEERIGRRRERKEGEKGSGKEGGMMGKRK